MTNALGVLGIPTMDWYEFGWIVVCLGVTIYIWVVLLKWIREDRYRRIHSIDGRLKIYYRGKIRLYSLGLVKAIMYVLLGVQASAIPPRSYAGLLSSREQVISNLVGITAPLSITANAVLLAVMLVLDDRDRKRMDDTDKESKDVDINHHMEKYALEHPSEGGEDNDSSTDASSRPDVGLSREAKPRRRWRHIYIHSRLRNANLPPYDHSLSEV